MNSILFVDDHPIYRDGLKLMLSRQVQDLEILVAEDVTSALQVIADAPGIDLCLADYRLPDGDGIALIARARAGCATMAVGILCAEPTPGIIARARQIGATACLSKERDPEALADALEQLFAGHEVFDDKPLIGSSVAALSLRRHELLVLASEGLADKQISYRLSISEHTVRNHWQHIFNRLQANNRTEAVAKAMRLRLI